LIEQRPGDVRPGISSAATARRPPKTNQQRNCWPAIFSLGPVFWCVAQRVRENNKNKK
jgi:hypothetical protein